MINEINAGQRYGVTGTPRTANKASSNKPDAVSQTDQLTKVDTVEIGSRQDTTAVTYEKIASKKPDISEIESLKAQAEASTENLRRLVKELILNQNKNNKFSVEGSSKDVLSRLGITAEDVDAARAAVAEDGEFGIKAVSDRLVDFAIAVSGGDKSKLSELTAAIDKGFALAKDALGGQLPDISQQTYDETMRKLDKWATE